MSENRAVYRVAKHDERLIERGGRVLRTIRLTPDASATLAAAQAAEGKSATRIINDLIVAHLPSPTEP